jgi:hypothetical protein
MLDGFAAHTHGLRVLIEPRLRGLDDVFVFPAFDAALVGRCALILERACPARLRQINPHFLAIFISGEVVRQLLAGRTAIGVVAQLTARRSDLHVIVTGRNAKPALIEAADLVTEMGAVKHHFSAGVKTQAGIEF